MSGGYLEPSPPQAGATGATGAAGTEINRSTLVPNLSEPTSLVSVREIGNWCTRCRDFKMPIFSEENWAGVFLGIAAGLYGGLWQGDFKGHPDRHHDLKLLMFFALAVGVALASLAISRRRKSRHDLSTLATEMDGACKAGRVPDATPEGQQAPDKRAIGPGSAA